MLSTLICGYKVEANTEGSPYNSGLATEEVILMTNISYRLSQTFGLLSESEDLKQANTRTYEKRAAYQTFKAREYRRKDLRRKNKAKAVERKFEDFKSESLSDIVRPVVSTLTQKFVFAQERLMEAGADAVISKLEDVILFIYTIKEASSFKQVAAIVAREIKTLCNNDKALIRTVSEYLFQGTTVDSIINFFKSDVNPSDFLDGIRDKKKANDLLDDLTDDSLDEFFSESEEAFNDTDEPNPIGFSKFIASFTKTTEGYGRVMASPLVGKVTTLVSTMLALGLINDKKSCSVTVGGLEVFNFYAAKGRKTSMDLVETVLDTITFLLERGHACFTTKSFSPLFTSVEKLAEYDITVADLIAGYTYVRADNFAGSPFMDAAHFELELKCTMDYTVRLIKSLPRGERPPYSKKLIELQKIKADFDTRKVQGGLRKAPFSFIIHGGSGVGKSTAVNTLMTHALQEIALTKGNKNFIVKESSICTLNEMDKYHSDYGSHILAVLLDDFANGKAEFAAKNPTVDVINFINNIHRTAIMAEAELKGKIPLVPCVVAATTNVKSKWAYTYSEEPLSILRRFQLHINMRVKKEYQKEGCAQLDPAKLAEAAAKGILCPDAWVFDVYEWVESEDGNILKATGSKAPVERSIFFKEDGKSKEAKNLNFGQLFELFSQIIPVHEKAQNSCVKSSKEILSRPRCPHGKNQDWCSTCKESKKDLCLPAIPETEEFEDSEVMKSESFFESISGTLNDYRDNMNCVQTYHKLCNEYSILSRAAPLDVYARFPERLREHPLLKALMMFNLDVEMSKIMQFWAIFFIVAIYLPLTGHAPANTFNWCFALFLPCMYLHIDARKALLEEMVSDSNAVHVSTVESIKREQIKMGKQLFAYAGLTASGIYIARQAYSVWRKTLASESGQYKEGVSKWSVTPERENVWKTPEFAPLPDGVIPSANYEDLFKVFSRQQCVVRFHHRKGTAQSNGFWLASNILVIPAHERPTEEIKIDIITRKVTNLNGVNLVGYSITPGSCTTLHEKSDLALVYIGSSGDKKDLRPFFPTTLTTRTEVSKMLTRNLETGEIDERACTFSRFGSIKTDRAFFEHAAHYMWPVASKPGLCGSPLIRDARKGAYVTGIHLAGSQKAGAYNACEQVTRGMLDHAILKMELDEAKPLAHAEGKMKTEEYGIDYTPEDTLDKKSPLNFISQDKNIQIAAYGPVPRFRVRPKTSVVESPLSPFVEKHCQVPQQWGPPANCRRIEREDGLKVREAPEWQPYQKFLDQAGDAHQEFSCETLERAFGDYWGKFELAAQEREVELAMKQVRPLSDIETVSGIDGAKFIDQMKPNTSMGFPINKPKEDFIIHLDPEEHDGADPKILVDEILESAYADCQEYLAGRRAYPVFKACTKDEPTKLTKSKVRVFQAAPAKVQYNMRKYYLSIAKFLSDHPLLSECAVGINSQGPQWHELDTHISKFGRRGRTVAGDFKAYDQHMSARMVMLAFKIMIKIAEKSGNYSSDDIKIMKGLMTDVAFPVMMVNGDLVQLFGSNPSGQNLTVYINSIVNALYHRCAFFEIYPDFEGLFHEVVALTTYGDDVKFSVSKMFDKYNHTNIQKIFAKRGIEYTMAEKDAQSVPYLDHVDADFLKRQSEWRAEYSWKGSKGMWIAKLSEDSIFKSLHCNFESMDQSRSQIAIQCLDGAMRELWFHGKEHFEMRHQQLKQVVIDAGLECAMPKSFYDGYEVRETNWLNQYGVDKIQE
ncbi:replicase polyprotein [Chaetoceros tenuissimus RNA virus 01]|uniref:Replicase polyprotein n=1 Tax=Chaetoceros tenuissimus RNA virus 01 TaxID=497136 RepID=B2DDE9_9VIRU|nr:replicase polyprotein [Chaetoceros tenuissimus RNA virus 01]BAG30951.1 replicase polyprotein [Chaetoceros tenuissimus RNA virus 01]